MLKIEIKESSIRKQMMLEENNICAEIYIQNGFEESEVKALHERICEDIMMDDLRSLNEIYKIYLSVMMNTYITDILPIEVIEMINACYNELSESSKLILNKYRNSICLKLTSRDNSVSRLLIQNEFEKILMELRNMSDSDSSIINLLIQFLKINQSKNENVKVLYTSLYRAKIKVSNI